MGRPGPLEAAAVQQSAVRDDRPQQLKTKETVGGRPPTKKKKKTTPFLPAGALHSRSNADGEAAALLPRSLFRERVALFHSRPLG